MNDKAAGQGRQAPDPSQINSRIDYARQSGRVHGEIKNPQKMRYLLGRGATADIYTACILGDIELAKKILIEKPNAIKSRFGHGDFKAVPHHVYPSTLSRPISAARNYGKLELVDYLLSVADPTSRFIYYCEQADEASAKEIIRQSPKIVRRLAKHEMATIVEAATRRNLAAV